MIEIPDRYWHLQMHLPYGRDGEDINPLEILREGFVATGEWDSRECRNFKELSVGTIILVRKGQTALALCQLAGDNFTDERLTRKYGNVNFRKIRILDWAENYIQPRAGLFSQGTLSPCGRDTDQYDYINKWVKRIIVMNDINTWKQILELKKNVILQGAPGTGKTYNTAALAVAICGVNNLDFGDHDAVMRQYEEFCREGRIGFCTFHQSMDYEDFVEGYKPQEKGNFLIGNGLFKRMCLTENPMTQTIYSKEEAEKALQKFKRFIANRESVEFLTLKKKTTFRVFIKGDKIKTDKSYNPKDDYIITHILANDSHVSNGSYGPAIVQYIIDNFLTPKEISEKDYIIESQKKTVRIKRAAAELNIGIVQLVNYLRSQGEMVEMNPNTRLTEKQYDILYSKFSNGNSNLLNESNNPLLGELVSVKNKAIIIDEINRGNVSKIFGELITLLEADKRIGGEHPIKLKLPYSGEEFGVPSNLYIIGTMNTTDRSVGNLDYAIRRRFAFITLKADRQILLDKYGEDSAHVKLFDSVYNYLNDDKKHPEIDMDDLMIGHSYFMAEDKEKLRLRLEYEIVPLVREYYKDGLLSVKEENLNNAVDDWRNILGTE